MRARALRVGLTGGIGSGKSTVAATLVGLGAALVDTDRIARELTLSGGGAISAIVAAFGADALDSGGALDRARMRERVFADAGARARLEAILHPMIGAETVRQATASAAPVVVFDVPLLVESGRWAALVDRVWVVDCRADTQRARVMARSGWSAETIDAVIAQQAPRAHRRAAADAVLFNDGITLEFLQAEVEALYREAVALTR
jgi:dephospho-CoA kinase